MNEEERFRLTKEERITGKKRVETLFIEGNSFVAYPFRVIYLEVTQPQPTPLSVLISVPKKRLKRAVKRNRIKRLFREAYRLNRGLLLGTEHPLPGCWEIAFIYMKDEPTDFFTIEKGVQKALRDLKQLIGKEEC